MKQNNRKQRKGFWSESFKELIIAMYVFPLWFTMLNILGVYIINISKSGNAVRGYIISILSIIFCCAMVAIYILNYRILVNRKSVNPNIFKFCLGLIPSVLSSIFGICLLIFI